MYVETKENLRRVIFSFMVFNLINLSTVCLRFTAEEGYFFKYLLYQRCNFAKKPPLETNSDSHYLQILTCSNVILFNSL